MSPTEFRGKVAQLTAQLVGHPLRPTVSHGRALVLYLLPQGRIDFTR